MMSVGQRDDALIGDRYGAAMMGDEALFGRLTGRSGAAGERAVSPADATRIDTMAGIIDCAMRLSQSWEDAR